MSLRPNSTQRLDALDAEKATFVKRDPLTNAIALADLPGLNLDEVPFLKVSSSDESKLLVDLHELRRQLVEVGVVFQVIGTATALYPDNTNASTFGLTIPNDMIGFNLAFTYTPLEVTIKNFRWLMASKPAGSTAVFAGGNPEYSENPASYVTNVDAVGTYVIRPQFTVDDRTLYGNALLITKLAPVAFALTISDTAGTAHTTDFTLPGGDNVDVHVDFMPANAVVTDLKVICVPPTGVITGFFQHVGGYLLENETDGNFAGMSAGVWAFHVVGTINGVQCLTPVLNVTF